MGALTDKVVAPQSSLSGHLGHISEFAATERALREVGSRFDAVASLGGELFPVYALTDRRVTNVSSHNKCSARRLR